VQALRITATWPSATVAAPATVHKPNFHKKKYIGKKTIDKITLTK
jgi:hypothetical protein